MARKRGNGEGTIYRRGNGYAAQYWVETANGRRRRSLSGRTRAEVAKKLAAATHDRDRGLVYEGEHLKVDEYLALWIADAAHGPLRTRSWERYEQHVRLHLVPALGHLRLKNLTPAHLRTLYREKLEAGYSKRTVEYIHTTISRALKEAVHDGLIPRNVAQSVKPPRPQLPEVLPLTEDESRRFLAAAVGDRFEALYDVALFCGLRQGELLGLRWQDVDLAAGRLSVRRSLSYTVTAGYVFQPTKNGEPRNVKLPRAAQSSLTVHRRRQDAERAALGDRWEDDDLVFPNAFGRPMDAGNLTKRSFEPIKRRAGVRPSLRLHDLRHTCATTLLAHNVSMKLVQELLGHKDILTTMKYYAHLLPGMSDGLADTMDELFGDGPADPGTPPPEPDRRLRAV